MPKPTESARLHVAAGRQRVNKIPVDAKTETTSAAVIATSLPFGRSTTHEGESSSSCSAINRVMSTWVPDQMSTP